MPSESLWQAVSKKEFTEVKKIIVAEPELINDVSERGKTLLAHLVLLLKPPIDLIQFLAYQPNLSFESPKSTQTTIDAILSTGKPELLAIFENDSRIIWDNKQLAYRTAKNNLELFSGKPKEENFRIMMQIIRDTTVRHAFANDDVNLLIELERAGDDPANEFRDGKLPIRLITKEHPAPKVSEWFDKRVSKKVDGFAASTHSFLSQIGEVARTQEKIDKLELDKATNDINFFNTAIEKQIQQVNVLDKLNM